MQKPTLKFDIILSNSFYVLIENASFTWVSVALWVILGVLNGSTRQINDFVLHKVESWDSQGGKSANK